MTTELNHTANHGISGLRPGETIQAFVARLQAENDALKAKVKVSKPKFEISEKTGVLVYRPTGKQFPVSMSAEQWLETLQDDQFLKFCMENKATATAQRELWTNSEEFKANQAKRREENKARQAAAV